jgi:hypothetical protein
MIFLTLTRSQAQDIAERTQDVSVLDMICSQMLAEDACDLCDEPKTIVFRDDGDGLRVAAMSFTNASAADQAWDHFLTGRWQRGH